MARKLEVQIVGDASSLHKALGQANESTKGFGGTLGSLTKTAGLVAGGAALGGLALVLHTGLGEWKQSTLVAAQTDAVIKSTGGAANITAKQVDALSGSLLKKTGVDDEAIKSGANMLLTFTNIRNEAGKGNDVFTQSTKTLLDMSVATGQDMPKAAVMMGKALNDPIAGIGALSRVGVTFTQGQKDSIKAMVAAGDTMGAQKVILGELHKEFGGSAEAAGSTLPGQLNILKETFNNLAGDLVGNLVPVFTTLVGFLTNHVMPAFSNVVDNVGQRVQPILHGLADFISTYVAPIVEKLAAVFKETVEKVGAVLQAHMPEIHQIFSNLGGVIQDIGKVAIPILKFAFETVLPIAIRILIPILEGVTGAIKAIYDGAAWVAKHIAGAVGGIIGAFKAILGPIEDIISAAETAFGWLSKVFGAQNDLKAPAAYGQQPVASVAHRAMGGPVSAGASYLVGENGPELLTMGGNGFITPNGGGGLTINLSVSGAVGDPRSVARALADAVALELTEKLRLGGRLAFT